MSQIFNNQVPPVFRSLRGRGMYVTKPGPRKARAVKVPLIDQTGKFRTARQMYGGNMGWLGLPRQNFSKTVRPMVATGRRRRKMRGRGTVKEEKEGFPSVAATAPPMTEKPAAAPSMPKPVKKPVKKTKKPKTVWQRFKSAGARVLKFIKDHKLASRGLRFASKLVPAHRSDKNGAALKGADGMPVANPWGSYLSHGADFAEQLGYGRRRKTKRKMRGGDFLGIGNFFRRTVPNSFRRFGNDVANAGRTVYNKALKPAGQYISKHPLSAISGATGLLGYLPTPAAPIFKGISAASGIGSALTGKGRRRKVGRPRKRVARRKTK